MSKNVRTADQADLEEVKDAKRPRKTIVDLIDSDTSGDEQEDKSEPMSSDEESEYSGGSGDSDDDDMKDYCDCGLLLSHDASEEGVVEEDCKCNSEGRGVHQCHRCHGYTPFCRPCQLMKGYNALVCGHVFEKTEKFYRWSCTDCGPGIIKCNKCDVPRLTEDGMVVCGPCHAHRARVTLPCFCSVDPKEHADPKSLSVECSGCGDDVCKICDPGTDGVRCSDCISSE